jgi:signal transduction histidine kinase
MLVLLAISILIILIFGGIELYYAQQGIKNDTRAYDLQDSRYLASYVGMYMDNVTSEMYFVATSPDTIRAMHGKDLSHLKEIADNFQTSTPQTSIVFFMDGNGGILYSTKPLDSSVVKSYSWYDEALKANTPYVTGLYHSYTLNDDALAILDPIKENNTILGRIVVVLWPQTLEDCIQSQIVNPNENVIIVDRNGLLIAHDKGTQLERYANCSAYPAVQNVLQGKEGVIQDENTWDHKSRILAFYPVSEEGWGVVVSTSIEAIYQPLFSEIATMASMLAIFALGLLAIGYVVADYLTSPITQLSGTIRQISSGSYGVRAEIKRSDEIGELAQAFNTMMDKLQQAEKAREDAKEQAELYVDLLSHDINNINQVALGYTELTLDAMERGDCDPSLLEKTKEMLYNSSALIDNVRKIQKIKAGVLKPELIGLETLIKDTIADYPLVAGREVNINYHIAQDCNVMASELLKDVFSNLIGNAIKHSTGPLTIDIEVKKIVKDNNEYCIATVSDNGPGIPDEKKKVLFTRFTRGATKAAGTGLGLYIVRSLVESFKGRVWIEDRIPGDHRKGSRFVVMLPASGTSED